MARKDIEIKGEIIAELEDINDPQQDLNLLEALMVEQVEVLDGNVTITLVFEDQRTKKDRWDIENAIYDALEELEGIQDVNIISMMRSALDVAQNIDVVQDSASPGPSAAPSAAPSAPEETLDRGVAHTVYSGGGCGAGTQVAIAPPVSVSAVPSEEQVEARVNDDAIVQTTAGGAQVVVLSLEAYTALTHAKHELALRPSLDEFVALRTKHQLLQARLLSLQDAVRALLTDA